jgi:hypothetical protein
MKNIRCLDNFNARSVAQLRVLDRYCGMKKTEPPTPASWDVYKIAKKAIWLGTVEAPDKQAAVEKAAQEFKTEVSRLYAMARR